MTKRNGQATDSSSVAPTLDELIAEAEEMRRMHQEFGSRLSRLLAALKSQRKQSRLLRQAVASIQGLDLGG